MKYVKSFGILSISLKLAYSLLNLHKSLLTHKIMLTLTKMHGFFTKF